MIWELAVIASEKNGTSMTAECVEAARSNFCHNESMQTQVYRLPVHMLSSSNEWCTPPWILILVRQVFCGDIDLDPCSNDFAKEIVQAGASFDQAADGLHREWSGKVFVNPPFGTISGRSQQGLFLDKSISEFHKGHVTEVLLILKAAIGYHWFGTALSFPHAWLRGLVAFHASRPSLSALEEHAKLAPLAANPHGSIMVYLGPHVHRFTSVFSGVAYVPGVTCWSASVDS